MPSVATRRRSIATERRSAGTAVRKSPYREGASASIGEPHRTKRRAIATRRVAVRYERTIKYVAEASRAVAVASRSAGETARRIDEILARVRGDGDRMERQFGIVRRAVDQDAPLPGEERP